MVEGRGRGRDPQTASRSVAVDRSLEITDAAPAHDESGQGKAAHHAHPHKMSGAGTGETASSSRRPVDVRTTRPRRNRIFVVVFGIYATEPRSCAPGFSRRVARWATYCSATCPTAKPISRRHESLGLRHGRTPTPKQRSRLGLGAVVLLRAQVAVDRGSDWREWRLIADRSTGFRFPRMRAMTEDLLIRPASPDPPRSSAAIAQLRK